jgi:hypothetical protein
MTGQPKYTLFQPFVPQAKTRAIPEKYLAPVMTAIEKYKQMTAQGVLPEDSLCHSSQTVETAPHIGRLSRNKNTHRTG